MIGFETLTGRVFENKGILKFYNDDVISSRSPKFSPRRAFWKANVFGKNNRHSPSAITISLFKQKRTKSTGGRE